MAILINNGKAIAVDTIEEIRKMLPLHKTAYIKYSKTEIIEFKKKKRNEYTL